MKGHTAMAAGLLVLLGGCGYTTGFGLAGMGVRSLGVEVVVNPSFRQRLEIPLTRQLQREVEARIAVTAAPPRRADAVLRVTIRRVGERPLAEGADDVVAVGTLVMTVDATLIDRLTGRVLNEGRVADREEFFINAGGTLDDATRGAAEKIARRLVLFLDPGIKELKEWRQPPTRNERGGKTPDSGAIERTDDQPRRKDRSAQG